MTLISSRSNPKIKQVRALRRHKSSRDGALFLVEGIRPVGEAVEAGARIESIVYAPEILRGEYAWRLVREQEAQGVPVHPVSADVFASIADKENPQGLLAVAHRQLASLADLDPVRHPWLTALVSPQDPGNVGTILRTIDAVGASGLLLLDGSVDLFHPGVVRASMGALFWHPVVQTDFDQFVGWAGRCGYHIYGTSAHGADDYRRITYERPAILLLGSERQGLTDAQVAACERLICLPMLGRATSLNLAVAAGVMLYAMLDAAGAS